MSDKGLRHDESVSVSRRPAKRMSGRAVYWQYKYLVERDGELCGICKRGPREGIKLEVDHVDGNPENNKDENIRLLCKRDNVTEYHKLIREHLKRIRESPIQNQILENAAMTRTGVNVSGVPGMDTSSGTAPSKPQKLDEVASTGKVDGVCERKNAPRLPVDGDKELRAVMGGVAFEGASFEVRLNRTNEPAFRRLVFDAIVKGDFPITWEYAENTFAEILGCSQEACRRYLKKATSPAGPYMVVEGTRGEKLLQLRPEFWNKSAMG